jgi:hypothetical protein
MKNNKKRYNAMEQDLLQQKLDKAQREIEELKRTKSNKEFILDTVMKERDRVTLAIKYITHLLLVMDSLDRILYDDPTVGFIVKDAILEFKTKLNKGLLQIKYNNKNLWFDGDYNDETDDEDCV